MTYKIKLGTYVKDRVTGLEGTAYARLIRMHGNVQIMVQPCGDGTTIPESTYIDEFTITTLNDGLLAQVPFPAQPSIVMGQKVKEIVSGQIGIVSSRIDFMNGCVQFEVTPEIVDNKPLDAFWVDHSRLEVISTEVISVKQSETGGPMHRGHFKAR